MKLLAPFAAILAALAAAIILDGAPPQAELVFVNRAEIFTLDPQRMSWLQDFRMGYALYEGLVRWDTRDFTIQPAAAAEWSAGDDGLTYTFRLRPDARWSNGDPLTAHDFVFAWQRAMLPDTASDYSSMFMLIDGAERFFGWRREALAAFAARSAGLGAAARSAAALELWEETARQFRETVALRATDDRVLQVRLVRPVPYFLDLVAFGVFAPVHRPSVEGWPLDAAAGRIRERGWAADDLPPLASRRLLRLDPASGRLEQRHEWTKPPVLVSNGPYMLLSWRYRRGMYLEANPFYHSPQLARARTIACASIEDVNTGVLAFESGRVDWLSDVSADYQADLLEERLAYERRYAGPIREGLAAGRTTDEILRELPPPGPGERRDISAIPAFGTDFYSFNCRPRLPDGRANPFADARVRRAFVMSVDKAAITARVTRLHEPVATTLIPPGSIPGYRSPQGLPFDLAAAQRELAAAGWADRDGDGLVEDAQGGRFPVIDLLYTTNTTRFRDISLALRDMWQRALGVRVELRGKESKFFKEDLKRGNFMIGRGQWYGDYGDPTTFLDMCRSGDGNNDRGYSSERVDALLDEAARERDSQERMRLLEECERVIVQEDVPMVVLYQPVQLYMYDPARVSGLSHHPRLVQYLWQVKADRG